MNNLRTKISARVNPNSCQSSHNAKKDKDEGRRSIFVLNGDNKSKQSPLILIYNYITFLLKMQYQNNSIFEQNVNFSVVIYMLQINCVAIS
jgi:hypothetical protein